VRADAAAADRNYAVRDAARGWRKAGAIDDATLAAVNARWPDDRRRLGPVFRILVAIFTMITLWGFLGIVALSTDGKGMGGVFLVLGTGLCVLADLQIGPLRRSQGGTEAATALVGISWLLCGIGLEIDSAHLHGHTAGVAFFVLAGLVCAAAAYRWGYPLSALVAAGAWFGALLMLPGARMTWAASAILVPLFVAASDSARLPPAHRRCLEATAAVFIVALYVAVHLGSWDQGLLETFREGSYTAAQGLRDPRLRWLSVFATALVPLLLLIAGIRTRRPLLLGLGALLTIASLVTLRFYVHVAPLWIVLTASGAALITLALLLRRWLDASPTHERGGFTAFRLFEHARAGLIEVVGAVASFSPHARPIPGQEPGLEPGGGEFGGGGASGKY
jgi:hypothetical protein